MPADLDYVELKLPPLGESVDSLKPSSGMRTMRALADKAVADKEERRRRKEA